MVAPRQWLDSRSTNCLRKYRIFFVFGISILCIQVYLAYTFLTLENEDQRSSRRRDVRDFSLSEEGDGLPRGTRQLKLPPDKQANSNKSQPRRNRTTAITLDRKSLNFTPICDVSGREAVSAITRAQSQLCKQRIANVTCLSQKGVLYPTTLQSSCPHSLGFTGVPKNVGCFKDDKTFRVLTGYYAIYKGNNSPQRCAYMCLQSGYPFAGTEYSVECFCGMEEPPQINQLPDSSCNMKCPGDSKQSCGGYLTINVFHTGIRRFKAQEARNSSLSGAKEDPARIAYLITVNGRASRQVKRLIRVLYHHTHLFYIHVDARQDYLYREMLEVERKCKTNNIKVARGEGLRHASIWGGASLLTTLLSSARQMLTHPKPWDFLVNLSESDYPVKNNTVLTEFLTRNKGLNFVKSHGREVQRFITKQGLDKTFVECEARMWRTGDRKLPNGIQIDGGSDWVALSRDFVEYVADPNPDSLVAGLLKFFQYTLLPAESFFHTTLRNSRFCQTYVDNNLHVTNWKRKLGCKCQYKAVVDWCGCSPNDFKLEDFTRLRGTSQRNIFFARKFEPVIDQRIIDRVEQWLYPDLANASINSKGYDMYWQSLFQHADLSPLADDTLLTISNSLSRIAYRRFNVEDVVHLLEATAYFHENRFVGILIRAETNVRSLESSTLQAEFPEQIESLVFMKKNFSTSLSWLGKVRDLSVNIDYDQKEQTFRNLIGGIGPFSSPVLAFEFEAELVTPQNITVLWVDPRGSLADVNYVQLEETTPIGHVRPQLNEPLHIGAWQVILVSDGILVAQLRFLVTPLAYWRNQKISPEKAREIHNGPSGPYHIAKDLVQKWTNFLKPLVHSEEKLRKKSLEERIGWELDQWIDILVTGYYEINKICYASGRFKFKPVLQKCSATRWSSLSPDTKSDVHTICQN
ncbi:xylosyltransferase oxt [Belonocnema kinseyi]|uniref:xylosyltransferase oxt n=1 Tax=Belonocnema kinseyi TaxID=2817044 RepID=UPI00143DD16B|nr:xylosyltransferase oxt [Belonocnema kinseyi]